MMPSASRTSYSNQTWFILNWNVHGANSADKWPHIYNKIEESAASIVCIQETKKEEVNLDFIKNIAPRRFDHFTYVPSEEASGGLLIVWIGNLFTAQVLLQECFGLVLNFQSTCSADNFTLANIYGPCDGIARDNFVAWLFHLNIPDESLWLLVGDFNFYRFSDNRNRERANINDMATFNEIISYLSLVELPIKG
jgi:exonuclease III